MSNVFDAGSHYLRLSRGCLRRRELVASLVQLPAFRGLTQVGVELVKSLENQESVVDLCLFDFDADQWWVGQVVLSETDFDNHLAEVRILRGTSYLAEDVEAVAEALPDRVDDLARIMANPPAVVCLACNPHDSWAARAADNETQLAIVEVFRAAKGGRLIRVDGQALSGRGKLLAKASRLPGAQLLFRVRGVRSAWPKDPALLWNGELIDVQALESGDDILITTTAAPGLAELNALEIRVYPEGFLTLQPGTSDQ